MKKINVVAAIIEYQGRILCMQRGLGKYDYISYKYEFPGGKIEPNELGHVAINREIQEEMGMQIAAQPEDIFCVIEHEYPDFKIRMAAYRCQVFSPEIHLHDHIAFQWCTRSELLGLDWAEADLPIVDKLIAEGDAV